MSEIAALSDMLLKNAPDAVLAVSMDGRIKYWNHTVESLFGYTRSEVVGQSFAEWIVLPVAIHTRRLVAQLEEIL